MILYDILITEDGNVFVPALDEVQAKASNTEPSETL